ncbi:MULTISPECIES: acyl-CoA dehydrogenase family protein [Pseudomonas]|uniref:acyl-CoA dehydrogenase family protein n=1 Tax=Pseudomonas TaxID=286 RepID=UPI000C6CF478|nr:MULTISPECIES: acyl-CoA dehydrogenase family protein [Pseudomonas]MDD1977691.1 acyl-CoA dehydrogenase family protein [Pseudomonas putida]QYX48662.1 acyl-CoA dehydrogenase family protein [Pseudomonas sp. S11A 273]
MQALDIRPCHLDAKADALRTEVREFLADALKDYPAEQRAKNWNGADPDFSRKLGARGWLGMTWPKRYGGHERSALERYVVLEELLAAGAPVNAHWIAERQSGPLLMKFSPEVLAPRLLPAIARGELLFCIGMSEPDVGSDLASVRTRAQKTDGGWLVNGSKVWTTGAQRCHYMVTLLRTGPKEADNRHTGLSQLLIDMQAPGVTVRPIYNMLGEHDFNEVFLENVFVPDDFLIGKPGDGWKQVGAELALERSGPERYLSCTQLYLEMLDAADANDSRQRISLGRVAARYAALRQMSLGVAGMLARGENPATPAALVKDQGALLEQALPDLAHDLFGGSREPGSALDQVMRYLTQTAPSFSLRGGTREILRGIIARGLGLR